MLKEWFERESEEKSKSDIRAWLNIISSQADTEVQPVGDVVSNKVSTLQETESIVDVKILRMSHIETTESAAMVSRRI